MTASQKPKTPTMTLPVASTMSVSEIDAFCKKASRLTLSQLVDNVVVEETLMMEDGARRRNFRVTTNLFPRGQYEREYRASPREILHALGATFGTILKKEIHVELKKLNADLKAQISNVGKAQAAPRERGTSADGDNGEDIRGADEEDGVDGKIAGSSGEELPPRDDASEVGDGDAEEEKRMRQTRQMSYESDSEDEAASGRNDEEDDAVDSEAAEDGAEDESVDAGKLSAAKWAEWAKTAGEELSDKCSYVVPGSFSFEYRLGSQCKFDINVRVLVLFGFGPRADLLHIHVNTIVRSGDTKATAGRHHRAKLC
jgi:hypothetical protein